MADIYFDKAIGSNVTGNGSAISPYYSPFRDGSNMYPTNSATPVSLGNMGDNVLLKAGDVYEDSFSANITLNVFAAGVMIIKNGSGLNPKIKLTATNSSAQIVFLNASQYRRHFYNIDIKMNSDVNNTVSTTGANAPRFLSHISINQSAILTNCNIDYTARAANMNIAGGFFVGTLINSKMFSSSDSIIVTPVIEAINSTIILTSITNTSAALENSNPGLILYGALNSKIFTTRFISLNRGVYSNNTILIKQGLNRPLSFDRGTGENGSVYSFVDNVILFYYYNSATASQFHEQPAAVNLSNYIDISNVLVSGTWDGTDRIITGNNIMKQIAMTNTDIKTLFNDLTSTQSSIDLTLKTDSSFFINELKNKSMNGKADIGATQSAIVAGETDGTYIIQGAPSGLGTVPQNKVLNDQVHGTFDLAAALEIAFEDGVNDEKTNWQEVESQEMLVGISKLQNGNLVNGSADVDVLANLPDPSKVDITNGNYGKDLDIVPTLDVAQEIEDALNAEKDKWEEVNDDDLIVGVSKKQNDVVKVGTQHIAPPEDVREGVETGLTSGTIPNAKIAPSQDGTYLGEESNTDIPENKVEKDYEFENLGISKVGSLNTAAVIIDEDIVVYPNEYTDSEGNKQGQAGRIDQSNSDIAKQLSDKLNELMKTTLPDYSEMRYKIDPSKNDFYNNAKQYGILNLDSFQDNDKYLCKDVVDYSFQILLSNDFINHEDDNNQILSSQELIAKMEVLRRKIQETRAGTYNKKQLFWEIEWSVLSPEFNSLNNTVILRANFNIKVKI